MDKTMIGLLAGATALALVGGVKRPAAASYNGANALQGARSFAEPLAPIPNAAGVLRAEHERDSAKAAEEKPFQVAQYYDHHHYHHYHYHHYHHYHHAWPWRRHHDDHPYHHYHHHYDHWHY